jgi:hypothetical protein
MSDECAGGCRITVDGVSGSFVSVENPAGGKHQPDGLTRLICQAGVAVLFADINGIYPRSHYSC